MFRIWVLQNEFFLKKNFFFFLFQQIPPKCNDRNSNVNGNDSNKENV